MIQYLITFVFVLSASAAFAGGTAVSTTESADKEFVQALVRMMDELRAESREASVRMRDEFAARLPSHLLHDRAALQQAIEANEIAPIPDEVENTFNLLPRVDGRHPIGEKDLPHQNLYVAARPAALGCLIDIASRVKSGPVEVTSLVRHSAYQQALRRSNGNANTSVPTHAMGFAFDIGVLNTPLPTVLEIRDVLREMRDEGLLIFVAERRQLVFHVVPAPEYLDFYAELYRATMSRTMREASKTDVLADRRELVVTERAHLPEPPVPAVGPGDLDALLRAGLVAERIVPYWPLLLLGMVLLVRDVPGLLDRLKGLRTLDS